MASNETSNYALSQWAEDDRILMADFNSDNAKIDAAIKANAESIASSQILVKLDVPTLSTETDANGDACVTADLSGVDMSRYRALVFGIYANGSSHTSPFLRVNHDSGANYSSYSSSTGTGFYLRNGISLGILSDLGGVRFFSLTPVNEARNEVYSSCVWSSVAKLSIASSGGFIGLYGILA